MKKLLFFLSTLTILFSSCTKECDDFHEGKGCKIEIRENYFGTYVGISGSHLVGTDETESSVVYSEVSTNSDGAEYLKMDQFKIKLTDSNGFEIPLQQVLINGVGYNVEGSGSFEGSHLIYTAIFTQGTSTVISTFSGSK